MRLVLRRNLRAGWLNHVLTKRCQSLWKCPLGIMLLRLPISELEWKRKYLVKFVDIAESLKTPAETAMIAPWFWRKTRNQLLFLRLEKQRFCVFSFNWISGNSGFEYYLNRCYLITFPPGLGYHEIFSNKPLWVFRATGSLNLLRTHKLLTLKKYPQ